MVVCHLCLSQQMEFTQHDSDPILSQISNCKKPYTSGWHLQVALVLLVETSKGDLVYDAYVPLLIRNHLENCHIAICFEDITHAKRDSISHLHKKKHKKNPSKSLAECVNHDRNSCYLQLNMVTPVKRENKLCV